MAELSIAEYAAHLGLSADTVRRRGEELAATVALLREQLEARAQAEEELRVLLLRQTEQLTRLLPAPHAEPLPDETPPTPATETKATEATAELTPEPEPLPQRKGWRSWLVWQR
jgi:hypothetical protein